MLHVWAIVLFGVLLMHDGIGMSTVGGRGLPWWAVVALSLGPLVLTAGVQHGVLGVLGRLIDTKGSWKHLRWADRTVAFSRLMTVFWHGVSVLLIGWLDIVRSVIGNVVVVDELVAITPAILVFAAGWWSFYPIERRLRDAATVRSLDEGLPMYPSPSRWQWVVMCMRHGLLISLVPLTLLAGWSEWMRAWLPKVLRSGVGEWLREYGINTRSGSVVAGIEMLLSVGGGVFMMMVTPLLIRWIWDTRTLAPGPTRTRLDAMSAQAGVRVRDVLIWRTYGTMLNGAVMGLWWRVRYVLLTDALLDQLTQEQVEAVMAHELAHAKYRHLLWLMLAIFGALGLVSIMVWVFVWAFTRAVVPSQMATVVLYAGSIAIQLLGLLGAAGAFLLVSRRFEWQADAFAAKYLSGAETVTAAGAGTMSEALLSVATLNRMALDRGSWRHGTINLRRRRLHALVDQPIKRLPVDSSVRWIKFAIAVAFVSGLVGAGLLPDPVFIPRRISESVGDLRSIEAWEPEE